MIFIVLVGATTARLVDDANFCRKEEACSIGCKKLYSGITQFRWSRWTDGKCMEGNNGPYCQCTYNSVNIPCRGGSLKCPPSPSDPNLCSADAACSWACRKSFKGSSGSCVKGLIQTDSVFSPVSESARTEISTCLCSRTN